MPNLSTICLTAGRCGDATGSLAAVAADAPSVGSLLDLTGRVALVTGASGNIGAGIARRLHEAGASVVAHARDDATEARAVLAARRPRSAVVGDVQRDAGAIVAGAIEAFGRLDMLVNNAGIQPVAPLAVIGDDALAEMFRVNAVGVAAMTREATAAMTARRRDRQRRARSRACSRPRTTATTPPRRRRSSCTRARRRSSSGRAGSA